MEAPSRRLPIGCGERETERKRERERERKRVVKALGVYRETLDAVRLIVSMPT